MKAREFIQRIQELIDVNGDVEVVIGCRGDEPSCFEKASIECQNVTPNRHGLFDSLHDGNTETVIKVW